jgi:hypothetical protein
MYAGTRYNLLLVFGCICLSVCFHNCSKLEAEKTPPPSTPYSFFVAGHVYGNAGVNNIGLHPPFRLQFDYIQSAPNMAFGVFTGDIVSPHPQSSDWDEIDADITALNIPVYFTAGNHDMENRPVFESRYGPTYYDFSYNNDLFIVLDPNLDNWNISGEQLDYVAQILQNNRSTLNNIFVFFHQMLWWEADNEYSDVVFNSQYGRNDSINFWTEVEPLFRAIPNCVTFFCGDLGGGSWADNIMYDQYENITLAGSGMGNGVDDNFLLINVGADRSLNYEVVHFDDAGTQWKDNLEVYRH